MSDLFSIYEDSLNVVLKNVNKIISSMKNLSKEKTENALNEAHNNLKEADRILKQMELEIESEKNQSSSNILNIKYRNYKSEVEMNRRHFLKLQENYINKKSQDALMILESYDSKSNKKNQKKGLLENEEIYNDPDDNKDKKIEMVNVGEDKDTGDRNADEDVDPRDEIFETKKNKYGVFDIVQKRRMKIVSIVCAIIAILLALVLVFILKRK